MNIKKSTSEVNIRRRSFIKYVSLGGAAFFVGKFFNPFINMLHGDKVLDEKSFENFVVTETGKQLKFADKSGNDILIIDKNSF